MNIRAYIYNGSIFSIQIEVLGIKHLTFDFTNILARKTLEIFTSGITSNDADRYISMCEGDVLRCVAKVIDIIAEPIEMNWKPFGINSTTIIFDNSF